MEAALRRERELNAPPPHPRWRHRLYTIIFEADTPAGRAFDVGLILTILASVAVVMLESIAPIRAAYGPLLRDAEWAFTLLFTLEYGLRLLCVRRASGYALSFFGIVDLLAILPTYLSFVVPGAQFLLVIRMLRILRVFRVLKLVRYFKEANTLRMALYASRRKIVVFVFSVITLVTVLGAVMYLVEGGENGFTSIPQSVYWAVVTLTTVGYGDIAPATPLGQFCATIIMLLGYGIIAVPTGIVTVEIANATRAEADAQARADASDFACPRHPDLLHTPDARFCRRCGTPLQDAETGRLPDQGAQ